MPQAVEPFIDHRHALDELRGASSLAEGDKYNDSLDFDGDPFDDDPLAGEGSDEDALGSGEHAEGANAATSGAAGSNADAATASEGKTGATIIPHDELADKAGSTNGSNASSNASGSAAGNTNEVLDASKTEGKSLFEQSVVQPTGEAGKAPVKLADDTLIEIDGQLVPWHTVRAGTMLKREYDKELSKLETEKSKLDTEKAKVQQDKVAVEVAAPYVQALIGDPFGKAYMEGLVNTGDANKAMQMASIASGVKVNPAAGNGGGASNGASSAESVDPRLAPPTDTQGQPLEKDDPRYLTWLAESAPIKAELAAERKWNELEAEKSRKEQAERDAIASRDRSERELRERNEKFTNDVVEKNVEVLKSLPAVLQEKGVAVGDLTQDQWRQVRSEFATAAVQYGKNVTNDDWLKQNLLEKGDVTLVVDASGLVAKIDAMVKGSSATSGTTNKVADPLAGNGSEGPKKVAEVEPGDAGQNPVVDPRIGKLRLAHQTKRPLNAGGPSQAIAGVEGDRGLRQNPDDGYKGAFDELRRDTTKA